MKLNLLNFLTASSFKPFCLSILLTLFICGLWVSGLTLVHQSCQGGERIPFPRKKPTGRDMQLISCLTGAKTNFHGHDVLASCFFLHSRATGWFHVVTENKREGRKIVKVGAPSAFVWDGPVGLPLRQRKKGLGRTHSRWGNPGLYVALDSSAYPKSGEVNPGNTTPGSRILSLNPSTTSAKE